MKLLAGTSKGLVVFEKDKKGWDIAAIYFEGLSISMVFIDERTNTWWVAISHRHWGEKLHTSTNEGVTWSEVAIPSYAGHTYKLEKPAALKKIWVMQQAGVDRPGCLWLGTEPGGLFFSDDGGRSFHLNESLWNHPSRLNANQWFGAGKDYPFIHSIAIDPRNSDHVYVGVSCAGIFKTTDSGKTWAPRNKGLVAAYLPNPTSELGHDPHRIFICEKSPDVVWQQNHCGIFRSTDAGEHWNEVSGEDGFPKYGFSLATDNNNPEVAWVIPAHSDELRIPVDLALVVCKTEDGGKNWRRITNGLPGKNVFDIVLRHSFAKKSETLAFGTNNGNVYMSHDNGNSWSLITQNLATVNYITFAGE